MKEAYGQALESEEDEDSAPDHIKPLDVGHNIYILAHQVSDQYNLHRSDRPMFCMRCAFCRQP